MGQIKGDVEVLGISNLLQTLSMAGCKGYLTIVLEGQKKVIHFLDDGIRLISGARRTNPLGEILIRTGKITRDQLDELLAEQRRTVREVVNASTYPRFVSMRAIYRLLVLGYIKAQDRKGNTVKVAPAAQSVR